jgi:hypothetical protein
MAGLLKKNSQWKKTTLGWRIEIHCEIQGPDSSGNGVGAKLGFSASEVSASES